MNKEKFSSAIKENFEELNSLVNTYLMAKVYTEEVRPIVLAYQSEILAEMKPEHDQKFTERDPVYFSGVITNPKDAYLMSDEDHKEYCRRTHKKALAAGFDVKPDYCPLLIAEEMERKAMRYFLQRFCEITEYVDFDVLRMHLETYKKVAKMTVTLIVTHPMYKQPSFETSAN